MEACGASLLYGLFGLYHNMMREPAAQQGLHINY